MGYRSIVNNTISCPGHGILVTGIRSGSSAFGQQTMCCESECHSSNGLHGISVTLFLFGPRRGTISDNLRNGINVDRASQANVSDNTIDANGQNGIFVTENSGVNLGSDTGAGIFDAPNRTTVTNGLRGISCRVGGYANGRLGTLNGIGGAKTFGTSCLDSLDTPDTF
jgi:parallel beta-helix repeat protein